MEPAGLGTSIIVLRHMARTHAKQFLSPCVFTLQARAFRFILSSFFALKTVMKLGLTVGLTMNS